MLDTLSFDDVSFDDAAGRSLCPEITTNILFTTKILYRRKEKYGIKDADNGTDMFNLFAERVGSTNESG